MGFFASLPMTESLSLPHYTLIYLGFELPMTDLSKLHYLWQFDIEWWRGMDRRDSSLAGRNDSPLMLNIGEARPYKTCLSERTK